MVVSVSTVSNLLGNLDAAEQAHVRVQSDIDAVKGELPVINFDVVSGASMILGVYPRLLPFRERMARLIEFDIANLDKLPDYAVAAWYVYITNLPAPEPAETDALIAEVSALRAKYLLWADPLVGSGVFEKGAIDKVKEGSGFKDTASDVVALVGLYRAHWDKCRNSCGVTEADLERGAMIAPRVFGIVSQREQRLTSPSGEHALRIRRAWALPERAYAQCRRAVGYLLNGEGDIDELAPNVRRNSGPAAKTRTAAGEPQAAVGIEPTQATSPPSPLGGSPIGAGDSPFGVNR